MKQILPSAIKVVLLDASGAAYVATIGYGKPAVNTVVVDSTGASYKASINATNTFNFAVTDVTGASFKATSAVIEVPAVAASGNVVVPPTVVVTTENAYSILFQTPSLPKTTEQRISTFFPSGVIEEILGYRIQNYVADPIVTEATLAMLSTYSYGSFNLDGRLLFRFTIPRYKESLKATKNVSYYVAQRFSKRVVFSRSFLASEIKYRFTVAGTKRLTVTKGLTYGIASRVTSKITISAPISSRLAVRRSYSKMFWTSYVSHKHTVPLQQKLAVSKQVSYLVARRLTSVKTINAPISARLQVSKTYKKLLWGGEFAYHHTVPLQQKLTTSKSVLYGISERLSKTVNLSLPILMGVQRISSVVKPTYGILKGVRKEAPVSYRMTIGVQGAASLSYEISTYNRVRKSIGISYVSVKVIETVAIAYEWEHPPIPTSVDSAALPEGTTFTPNPDGTTSIVTPTGITYTQLENGTILPVDTIGGVILHSQDSDILSVEPLLIVNGEYVSITDMTISIDEGNFTYNCDAKLGNYTDMLKFEVDTEFYAVLQGEIYAFIVDSRSINRQDVSAPSASVKGVSFSNRFTGNRSKQILGTTFSEGGTAYELAIRVMSDTAINRAKHILDPSQMAWEILNWQIPPFRFGVENTYPLDGIKTIVEAVGGVIESYPDGRLRIRYKHPIRVPDYNDSTISHEFFDDQHILSIEEQYAPNRKVNSIYVKTFQDIGTADQVEFFDQPGLAGVDFGGFVRVFPAFWRDEVELTTTRRENVTLEYMGVEYWRPGEIDPPDFGWEFVEIVRSQASVKYPIHSIVSYEYFDADCGEIILQDYNKTFYTKSETERFSIMRVAYTTKCHKWRVSAPAGAHIQFLVKDNVFNAYLR